MKYVIGAALILSSFLLYFVNHQNEKIKRKNAALNQTCVNKGGVLIKTSESGKYTNEIHVCFHPDALIQ